MKLNFTNLDYRHILADLSGRFGGSKAIFSIEGGRVMLVLFAQQSSCLVEKKLFGSIRKMQQSPMTLVPCRLWARERSSMQRVVLVAAPNQSYCDSQHLPWNHLYSSFEWRRFPQAKRDGAWATRIAAESKSDSLKFPIPFMGNYYFMDTARADNRTPHCTRLTKWNSFPTRHSWYAHTPQKQIQMIHKISIDSNPCGDRTSQETREEG